MPREGYTNLTVEADRYDEARDRYDKFDMDITFTNWVMNLVEAGLDRLDFLEKQKDSLVLVRLQDAGFAIFDKKNNNIVRVYSEKNKIVCSDTKDPQKYITYATLHPEFGL